MMRQYQHQHQQPTEEIAANSTTSFVSTSDGDVEVTTHTKYNIPNKGSSRVRTHSRNLSAHFVDAAKLHDDQVTPSSNGNTFNTSSSSIVKSIMKQPSSLRNGLNSSEGQFNVGGNSSSSTMTVRYAQSLQDTSHPIPSSGNGVTNNTLKKRHRRNQSSGGSFNSVLAHRRVNSMGSSVAVLQKNHFRENSEGLDILSAVADLTEEDMAAVAGSKGKHLSLKSFQNSMSNSKSLRTHSRTHSLMGGPIDLAASSNLSSTGISDRSDASNQAEDKHDSKHGRNGSLLGSLDHTGTALLMSLLPLESNSRESFPQSSSHKPSHERKHSLFPLPEQAKHDRNFSLASDINPNLFSMGSGLSPITSISNVIDLSKSSNLSLDSNALSGLMNKNAPHHRHMSSLGMMASLLPRLSSQSETSNENNHHQKSRNLSSSKFLLNLEESIDANIPGGSDFLRGLTETSVNAEKKPSTFCPPLMTNKPRVSIEIGRKTPVQNYPINNDISSNKDVVVNESSGSEAKPKRARRKCNIEGCPNRVVQGGVCISHGAKRKTCMVEGCDKNVKKAGYCSAHGPARKRCEFEGCERVAVQGGKCISHGAKKKLCEVVGCTKQAILSGTCKKHHDEKSGLRPAMIESNPVKTNKGTPSSGKPNSNMCVVIGRSGDDSVDNQNPPSSPQHARRESFRGDNATVEAIFKNDVSFRESVQNSGASVSMVSGIDNSSQKMQSRRHKRGISLFADETVTDTILRNNLII